MANTWIEVRERLPEIGKPVLALTDYGKCDVCRLYLDDDLRTLNWVNDMRCQHSNGGVIAWCEIPAFDHLAKRREIGDGKEEAK